MFNPPSILPVCLIIASCFVHQSTQAAVLPGGQIGDEQTSIGYDVITGEIFIAAPFSTELSSIRIASRGGIFTGDPADHLILPPTGFDIDDDDVIFKSTIGGSFGSLSLGNVAEPGLSQNFLLGDLDVMGSLAGGGELGPVDLIFVPEPSTAVIAIAALVGFRFRSLRSRFIPNRQDIDGQAKS